MKHDDKKSNHLKGQSSPYLLQHVYNPVDWYPWSKEALVKAVDEDKPILVSIGYSACHWCHVMEKESFEDREVAEIMNRNFVCIKVDREERPDIDHMYMTAIQLLTRQGGWPLNCFALPDTRPFWGGTYFPREQWKNILLQVAGLYESQKDDLDNQAEKLTRGVADSNFIESGKVDASFGQMDADHIFRSIMDHMDKEEGGTLHAPKFPLPGNLELLLHYFYHTGEKSALDQVELSLTKMAMGGIYDQVGGGFARYSTDELWKVPHFEKMLYDNGQLVSVYSRAWSVLKVPLFKDVVYQTIEFIERELASPEGAFYSALDADSEGEEGKYYVWNEKEIDNLLGDDSALFKEYYQVGKKGYWENGNNILLRDETDEVFCERKNISHGQLKVFIKNAIKILLVSRSGRVRPGLDNKLIVSWNALMISALADAYAAFGDDIFLEKATKAADYIIKHSIRSDGKMYRSLSGESASIDGFLDDYAFFIYSLIRLYEVSMNREYLLQARYLTEYVIENFTSSDTSLFSFSSAKGEKLMADIFEIHDNVLPSSNSMMALNLLYLSEYFESAGWARRSNQMLSDIGKRMLSYGPGFFNWGRLLFHNVFPFYTLVVCGPEAVQGIKEINARYLPGKVLAGATSDAPEIPVFKNRFRAGETWYYVCSRGSCKMPVQELEPALIQIIANDKPLS